MIQILEEFNNGIELCQKIYDVKYKILETTNNHLWNTDKDHPICIVKRRANEYIESKVLAEKIIDEE